MEDKFSGKASRLSWELFKRSGHIGYYLLYKNIENSPEPSLQDFALNQDDEREL